MKFLKDTARSMKKPKPFLCKIGFHCYDYSSSIRLRFEEKKTRDYVPYYWVLTCRKCSDVCYMHCEDHDCSRGRKYPMYPKAELKRKLMYE